MSAAAVPSLPYRTGKISASSGATPATEQDAARTRDETTELVAHIPDTGAESQALHGSVGTSYYPAEGGTSGRTVRLTTPKVSRQVFLVNESFGKSC